MKRVGIFVTSALLVGMCAISPAAEVANAPFAFGTYWLVEDGNTARIALPTDFASVGQKFPTFSADIVAPVLKFRVQVFTRTERLDQNSGGVFLARHYLEEPDLAFIIEGLKTAETVVESYLGGSANIEFELKTDAVPQRRYDLSQAASQIGMLMQSRLNDATFESDDRRFRGPFVGAIVVDADPKWPAGMTIPSKNNLETPVSVLGLPFSIDGTPNAFAGNVVKTLLNQLAVRANQRYYGFSLPRADMAVWKDALESKDPSAEDFKIRGTVRSENVSLGTPLTFGQNQLSVDPSFAPLFSKVLPRFANAMSPLSGAEFAQEGFLKPLFNSNPARLPLAPLPEVSGIFSSVTATNSDKGSAVEVKFKSSRRDGSARIWAVLPASSFSGIKFWIKGEIRDDFSLIDQNGNFIGLIPAAGVSPDEWRELRFALDPKKATELRLAPFDISIEGDQSGEKSLTFAGITGVTESFGNPFLSTGGQPLSDDFETINAALDSVQTPIKLNALYRALSTPDLRYVAKLKQLARSADVGIATLAINCLARSIDLPEQPGTTFNVDARAALRYALEVGPFEHCRWAVANALRTQPKTIEPILVTALSSILTSTDWNAREQAAYALGRATTQEAAIIQITMLPDPEPAVRFAVASTANTDLDLVRRRLLFTAVNDTNESVRAAAYQRLLLSKDPATVEEARKGVRDESKRVRVILLDTMARLGKEENRGAIRIGLADRIGEVRSAALKALYSLSNGATAEEIAPLKSDPHPMVQAVFKGMAKN
jgi:HEAT repeat protein